jgi:hypothetical protein
VNASLGKSKEKKKIEILVSLSLSVSCSGLGDRSLPSFVVAGSCMLPKLLHSRSCWKVEETGRLTWCGGKVWSWSRVKSLKEYY